MGYKYKIEWVVVDDEPKEGDYVMEHFTYKVGILGKTGLDTGASDIYNLDGSFYDISDMFDKVIPHIIEKKSFFGNHAFKKKL